MRKTYSITTKLNGETREEKTYYKLVREDDNIAVLGTGIESDDTPTIFTMLAKEHETDPLLAFYTSDGIYELVHVSLKSYPNGNTSVRLYFKMI